MTFEDIKFYDEATTTIELTDSGTDKMEDFKPLLFGTPFIIVANGKKILAGWFRPSYSSQLVDRVSVTIKNIDTLESGIVVYEKLKKLNLFFTGCGIDLRRPDIFLKNLKILFLILRLYPFT